MDKGGSRSPKKVDLPNRANSPIPRDSDPKIKINQGGSDNTQNNTFNFYQTPPEINRSHIARTEKLEEMYRESITGCKARFRAVIGDKQKAAELANDFSLGTTPANLDLKAQRLFILTGDFGIGKTLIVQRIFQNAESRARFKNK